MTEIVILLLMHFFPTYSHFYFKVKNKNRVYLVIGIINCQLQGKLTQNYPTSTNNKQIFSSRCNLLYYYKQKIIY